MRIIHYSTKAKKDLKKYRSNIRLMEALFDVLDMVEIVRLGSHSELFGKKKGVL